MKSIVNFFKGVYEEVSKVEWLPRNEWLKYTGLVIAFLVVSIGAIAGIDLVFIQTRGVAVNCINDFSPSECLQEAIFGEEEEETTDVPAEIEADTINETEGESTEETPETIEDANEAAVEETSDEQP